MLRIVGLVYCCECEAELIVMEIIDRLFYQCCKGLKSIDNKDVFYID